ncbi:hypothetical protein ZOD2009_01535 [Haladaptatus paucihalophilus DX253]|uniref:Uncharacterized conserved protein YjgD, DUF1641 family n=1 Tax=Haladaptatus paucihalophilus DX253 TaxID=797209 RepID=E7QMY9_HALPU|nr:MULTISPECIES: DUF1641 domain-containing protein [Haladaptatus]EFW93784.1 hypothetical protein ZOD2009_01535 [Haladaptatus paucihalophilus DX253]SHL50991.1 Uncharacterized conserved protein YjgD, DUF1641 family [Haladaptatus paucihalophilus DX253]
MVEQTTQDDARDALETAIDENPEEVARLMERLGLVNGVLDAVEVGTSALDDRMVAELAGTGETLAEAADGLATKETVELSESVGANGAELTEALETLVRLQKSGTLDELAALADLLPLASGALDDEMISTLVDAGSSLGEVADTASDPDTVRGMETVLQAVGDASDAESPPERVGVVGLLRATRDPEVQAGLGFVLAIAKALGRETRREPARK